MLSRPPHAPAWQALSVIRDAILRDEAADFIFEAPDVLDELIPHFSAGRERADLVLTLELPALVAQVVALFVLLDTSANFRCRSAPLGAPAP